MFFVDFDCIVKTQQGRKMVPCPFCDDLVPARKYYQCGHCETFMHHEFDGIHFKEQQTKQLCITCWKAAENQLQLRDENRMKTIVIIMKANCFS